jgi:hypothetical protein
MSDPITGAHIVGELLRDDNDFVASVPAEHIKLGAVPDGAPQPLVLIRRISSVDRDGLEPGDTTPTFDRVAVLVRADNYRDQCRLIKLVKDACRGKRGGFDTGCNFSVRPAGTGPDLRGPGNSYEQTQDFRVFYNA